MTTEIKANNFMTEIDNKAYNSDFFETHVIEKGVNSVVNSYMQLINSEIPDKEHQTHKTTLQKDFLNYIKSNNIDVYKANTADCIAKTAFSRLKNASENYYMNKLQSTKNEKLENLKQQAEQMKKEYELVKNLR
jgi:hypothetical protein